MNAFEKIFDADERGWTPERVSLQSLELIRENPRRNAFLLYKI
jgi:hypothetical protein